MAECSRWRLVVPPRWTQDWKTSHAAVFPVGTPWVNSAGRTVIRGNQEVLRWPRTTPRLSCYADKRRETPSEFLSTAFRFHSSSSFMNVEYLDSALIKWVFFFEWVSEWPSVQGFTLHQHSRVWLSQTPTRLTAAAGGCWKWMDGFCNWTRCSGSSSCCWGALMSFSHRVHSDKAANLFFFI